MHAPLPAAELRKFARGGECSRACVCCGARTPTQSMCACWTHWSILPEDLRADLLKYYGRVEIANYHRSLLRAIEVWRLLRMWRVSVDAD